ncbi:MAG: DUF6371 domain-containing protein [Prevotellaceae bacterium]|nr:DUF6371 domain-containing protein [Prevotellaceae bacterium]
MTQVTDKQYLYRLDRTSRKYTCPDCGRRSYVLYINQLTGEPLDPTVGRCDHQNSCGRHLPPRDFLREHPDFTSSPEELRRRLEAKPFRPESELPLGFIDKRLLPPLFFADQRRDNLQRFFLQKFGAEKTEQVFRLYHVGPSRHWISQGGYATVFPQIDTQGRVRQMKVICYNPLTGHRLHEQDPALRWSRRLGAYVQDSKWQKVWFAGKSLVGQQNVRLEQTYFGAHLLASRPGEAVFICESEKTAMVAHLMLQGGLWLATGGKNGCRWSSFETSRPLRGRRVYLYPDLGATSQWEEGAAQLRRWGVDARVSQVLEARATDDDRNRGLDVADFLLRRLDEPP